MSFLTRGVALTALLGASAALTTPSVAANQTGTKKVLDPNEMVCTSDPELGSRLVRHKTCMTRAQWAERRRNDRELVEHTQTQLCVAQGGRCTLGQ